MLKYVLKRIGLAIVTAFIILSLSFILIKSLPYSKPLGTNDQKYSYYLKEVNLGFVVDLPNETSGYGELLFSITTDKISHYFYQRPIFDQYFSWLKMESKF